MRDLASEAGVPCSLGCAAPPPHSQVTTPQVSEALTLTPEVLWVHSGPVGSVSELTPPPQSSNHPFSHLFPVPPAPPPSLSPSSFPFSCAKLTETITKLVFVFPFEASCYARWVPPPGSSGPRTEASLPLG